MFDVSAIRPIHCILHFQSDAAIRRMAYFGQGRTFVTVIATHWQLHLLILAQIWDFCRSAAMKCFPNQHDLGSRFHKQRSSCLCAIEAPTDVGVLILHYQVVSDSPAGATINSTKWVNSHTVLYVTSCKYPSSGGANYRASRSNSLGPCGPLSGGGKEFISIHQVASATALLLLLLLMLIYSSSLR